MDERPTLVDKILSWLFGGEYGKPAPRQDPNNQGMMSMDTFRNRVSVHGDPRLSYDPRRSRRMKFDFARWKPYGKHRISNPDQFLQQCQLLSPWVRDNAHVGWEGLEERRWAGIGGAPPPGPLREQSKAISGSIGGSREFLS